MINEERLLNEFIDWQNLALKPKLTTQAKKQAPLPATYGHLFLRIWITKFPA